jgi:hypothetical protein
MPGNHAWTIAIQLVLNRAERRAMANNSTSRARLACAASIALG